MIMIASKAFIIFFYKFLKINVKLHVDAIAIIILYENCAYYFLFYIFKPIESTKFFKCHISPQIVVHAFRWNMRSAFHCVFSSSDALQKERHSFMRQHRIAICLLNRWNKQTKYVCFSKFRCSLIGKLKPYRNVLWTNCKHLDFISLDINIFYFIESDLIKTHLCTLFAITTFPPFSKDIRSR